MGFEAECYNKYAKVTMFPNTLIIMDLEQEFNISLATNLCAFDIVIYVSSSLNSRVRNFD